MDKTLDTAAGHVIQFYKNRPKKKGKKSTKKEKVKYDIDLIVAVKLGLKAIGKMLNGETTAPTPSPKGELVLKESVQKLDLEKAFSDILEKPLLSLKKTLKGVGFTIDMKMNVQEGYFALRGTHPEGAQMIAAVQKSGVIMFRLSLKFTPWSVRVRASFSLTGVFPNAFGVKNLNIHSLNFLAGVTPYPPFINSAQIGGGQLDKMRLEEARQELVAVELNES